MKQGKFNSQHAYTTCTRLHFLSQMAPFLSVKGKRLAPPRKIQYTQAKFCSQPLLEFFIPWTAET